MAKKRKQAKVKKYSSNEIITMVTRVQESIAFQDLYRQMDSDFNLYTLDKFKGEEGHQAYTSPGPKNDFMKVFVGVNKANLTWQIAVPEDATPEQRKQAAYGEALISGLLNVVDRNRRKIGEPPLRVALTWFACSRGSTGLKCLIYNDDDKELVQDMRAMDPLHLVWKTGANGLVWAAHIYKISKEECLSRYKTEIMGDEDATIIDFFDEYINAIVLVEGGLSKDKDGQFIKEPAEHGIGHVPVFVGFSSGMPTVHTSDFLPTLKDRAASVWDASRGIYEPRNKQISFIMDVAEKSVAGTLTYRSRDGKKMIKGDPFGAWAVIPLAADEEIKELMPAPVPAASAAIMSILDRDKQESTIPFPIGYGLDPQAHSGAALSMMNDNTRSVYGPFTELLENAYLWLIEEVLGQFKAKGQKMKLQGFDPQGKFYELDADPDKIEDDWYIQVKVEPRLPRDEAAEVQMAMASTQPNQMGVPLLSMRTAREKIIKLQNPDAEQSRIEEEVIEQMILRMPNVQIRRAATKLLEQGDREGALELLQSIPPPPGAGAGPPAPGNGQMPSGGQPAMGNPLTPQELEKLAQVAAQLQAQGQPIPDEIKMALMAAQGMPAPGGK